MPAHSKKPQRQEIFLAALMTQPTIQLAAQAAGISEGTAGRWMRDADFQVQYREAKARMVGEAVSFLQQSMLDAVATLRQVMLADTTKPAQKIMAARSLLEMGLRSYELYELERRILALESTLGGNK